jgi:hypothetical protein
MVVEGDMVITEGTVIDEPLIIEGNLTIHGGLNIGSPDSLGIQTIDQHDDTEYTTQRHIQPSTPIVQNIPPIEYHSSIIPLEDAGIIPMKRSELGFDVIDGDVNIENYIKQNVNDNIAFKIHDSYYLSKKSQIVTMLNQGKPDNAIFYGCMCAIVGDWTTPETWALLEPMVIYNEPYFNIQQLGLPVRYVKLYEIAALLGGDTNYFIIEKSENSKQVPSFASDAVLNHGIGSMSGLHCQGGQADIIYHLKKYQPEFVDE